MVMRRLIVVVGVNGRQGSSVVEALLEYSDQWLIRGTTSDTTLTHSQELAERGVEMVKCDISNQEECCQAFAGAYGIFSINKYWDAEDQDEYKQAINIVAAAKKANVQHIITSGLPDTTAFEKSQFDIPLQPMYKKNQTQIEDYIRRLPKDSTFPHITFIQMGFYYQNFITFFALDPTNIEFRYPIFSPSRIPFYDVRDTGKVVRECFLDPHKWGNSQRIPIVAEQLTMEEICKTIQEMTTKNVHFVPLAYEEALRKLPRETVNILKWYNDIGSIDGQQAEKTNEIWPKMNKLTDWLRETQWLVE